MHQNPADVLKVQGQLFQKILSVLENVEKIEKSGFNSHQNYHYSTEQDLLGAVKQLLIKNKLIVLTDSETKEIVKLNKYDKDGRVIAENLVTVVNTRHTFCDTETGYTYPIQSTGTGFDNTDKGSFKAITGAMKYFVSKNFMVATDDDPENDGLPKKTPQQAVGGAKGFSRSVGKTAPADIDKGGMAAGTIPANPEIATNKVVEPVTPPVPVEKLATPSPTAPSRPSFNRRTTTKTEPTFP